MSRDMIRTLMFGMPSRLDAVAAEGLDVVIQFVLTGEAGGAFAIAVKNGAAEVRETQHAHPDLTLTMPTATYIDIAMGRLTGPQAFFQRKAKFTGSLPLVMKLHALFPYLKTGERGPPTDLGNGTASPV